MQRQNHSCGGYWSDPASGRQTDRQICRLPVGHRSGSASDPVPHGDDDGYRCCHCGSAHDCHCAPNRPRGLFPLAPQGCCLRVVFRTHALEAVESLRGPRVVGRAIQWANARPLETHSSCQNLSYGDKSAPLRRIRRAVARCASSPALARSCVCTNLWLGNPNSPLSLLTDLGRTAHLDALHQPNHHGPRHQVRPAI